MLLTPALVAMGQARDLPFGDNFESYTSPENFLESSGWVVHDADGDGHNWMFFYDDFDDMNILVSASYEGSALTPENWLVTPLLNLPADLGGGRILLSYDIAASGNNYYQEHYKVVVSTTGSDPEDFSDDHIVLEETLTDEVRNWSYARREIDLSAYAGEEVYIAFVHYDCTDQDWLLLNNVLVELEASPAGDLPFAENFESYEDNDDFLANSGWAVYDADGDGFNWMFYYDDFDDMNILVSASYEGGALTPENWLVTPGIALPSELSGGRILLSYDIAASGNNYYQEHYKVVVSTTGSDPEDFSDDHIVLEETLTDEVRNWSYARREIDLSAYAGEEIHIAFVHYECTDQDWLLLNNVLVELKEPEEDDLPFVENFNAWEDTEDFLTNSGWAAVDADGDGENWFLEEDGGMNVMASASWDAGALTPENWLITPQIRLPASPEEGIILLRYDVAASGNNFFEEHYKVVVSTTGNDPADFPDENIVLEETLTGAERGWNYASRYIDLSGYAGEAVYIAFVHYDCTDFDLLLINNVAVRLVNSAAVFPEMADFNPMDPQDVETVVTFFGATELTGVQEGAVALTEGTEYTVAEGEEGTAVLTIMAAYLESLPEGDNEFHLLFDSGDPVPFTVVVGATPENTTLSPGMADFDPDSPADVAFQIAWGSATTVASLHDEDGEVEASLWTVEGNTLKVLAAYFAELDPGYVLFKAGFDLGEDAHVLVRIMDHSVRSLPFAEEFQGHPVMVADTPEEWLPNGWVALDEDGDGFNWYFVPVISDGEFQYGRMQSRSYYNDPEAGNVALTPDNWLITPPIQLNSITDVDQTIELSFRVAPGANTPSYRMEHYSVMISYTDRDLASFDEL